MDFYNKTKSHDTSPAHIYKHAADAWNMIKHVHNMQQSNDQTILVSGDSGSGKTRSINFIIQYYSYITSATKKSIQIKNILLKTNLILESFGNAKTALNDNSSRFGKYIKLYFCPINNELVSANLITYLLEKTRSVNCPMDKSFNFHIFYELLFGSNESERIKFLLDNKLIKKYTNDSIIDNLAFAKKLNQLKLSFKLIDLDVEKIFGVISALAHLNCCLFTSELNISLETKQHLQNAANLLHFDLAELINYLLVHVLSISNRQNDLIKIPCNLNQIIMRKNSLIKLIYNELFKYLVKAINKKLEFDTNRHNCIGLLDIYGFESIDNANSLEQLCINYANEKLQKIFIDSYFKLNKIEYESEFPTDYFPIDYSDNMPLLNLLESSKSSLFCLLNEQSILKSHDHLINDDQLLLKIRQTFVTNDLIHEPKLNCKSEFFIRHYAGQVGYRAEFLVTKNSDLVPDDLLKFVAKSTFLSDIVGDYVAKLTRPGHKKSTVLSKFKKNLDNLISNLTKTNILYVRCIKPNCDLKPSYFNRDLVRNQLESCGIVSLLNLSKQGFINKFVYSTFAKRFLPILFFEPGGINTAKKLISYGDYKKVCMNVIKLSLVQIDHYRLGQTKIFLKEEILQMLNVLVENANNSAALRIQSKWRQYKRKVLCYQSASKIQCWWRTILYAKKCSLYLADQCFETSILSDSSIGNMPLTECNSMLTSNYLIELDIVDKKLKMKKQ